MAITPSTDGIFTYAVGKSRYETKWKNTESSWSDFLKRLSKTTFTAETYDEYVNFPKKVQDEKKDVGGFVGGTINGGRRKPENVSARSLLTLDVDFGKMDFWDEFCMAYPCAAAIYGTHKHHPDNPRFRLVLPFNRPVFADEYQAIARKIAAVLDIEIFDITTYQVERLMYWPSTPKDQKYYFQWQNGEWLDPDEILGSYIDWRDVSQWPVSKRESERITKAGEKQGDPLDKPGIVGAFCRTYTVTQAIETFLSEVYEPMPGNDGRWTFKHGSTAGGLVIYDDDKFAYSHHGTDPAGGKLCNAFDLVRLHKFGIMDEDVAATTNIQKRPSHLQMCDLAGRDKAVTKELVKTRLAEANADFKGIDLDAVPNEDGESSDDWLGELETDNRKNLLPTTKNINLILLNDNELKDCFGYDDFKHIDTAIRDLPWRTIKEKGEEFKEEDLSSLQVYFETHYRIWNPAKIKAAIFHNRYRVMYHPIKDWLLKLKWDGFTRINTLLPDFFGCEDNPYTRAVMRKSLVAAVARVMEPGCKFDNVLVLVGPEGTQKSMFFDKLGGKWFSDSLTQVDKDKAYEQLQGAWIIELGELKSVRRASSEAIKAFLAKRADRYRPAYGHIVQDYKRQCVFFGTTNEKEFLTDDNGDRRFWPVEVRPEWIGLSVADDLPEMVEQIWAEAVDLWLKDEPLFLDVKAEKAAKTHRLLFTEQDSRADLIREYLDTPIGEMETGTPGELRDRVSVPEVWMYALGGLRKDITKYNTKELHKLMEKIGGWRRVFKPFKDKDNKTVRGYVRIGSEAEKKDFL